MCDWRYKRGHFIWSFQFSILVFYHIEQSSLCTSCVGHKKWYFMIESYIPIIFSVIEGNPVFWNPQFVTCWHSITFIQVILYAFLVNNIIFFFYVIPYFNYYLQSRTIESYIKLYFERMHFSVNTTTQNYYIGCF